MIKSFYLQLISRIMLIVTLSVVSTVCFLSDFHFVYGAACSIVMLIVIFRFIKFLNTVNEQISFFFESILNEDFNSVYALKRKSKILDKLNENLDKVNRKMQDALMANARQEQYFKALIEHVGTGIITCNKDGFVIDANAGFKQLVGLEQLTHTKQLQKVDSKLMEAVNSIRHKEQKIVGVNNERQGDTVRLLLKAAAFNTGAQNLMLISAQNIDKELDENELDSWMKLIRVLTHEIMNSIAPITSLSETIASLYSKEGKAVLAKDIDDRTIETTIRGLNVIREQGKGLINFVESYRSLMRLPKPKKERVKLYSFLEKQCAINQAKEINMQLLCADEDRNLSVCADKEQLGQVLANLIKNAIYALKGSQNPEITIGFGTNQKNRVEISVKDNGPGIDPDLLEEIFIPFFTTKETGSGIGLSLSRQIMRLHGGWLKAQSVMGKESVFTMVLPKEGTAV
ncbi:Histidine kinase-, DNA gyrase B-, and HSP90-like ATPase [Saccharicrinis carchari]|uniref:histidine kinase n=1 Tax=Saccharicrinis carchari TaxID=1168039 RepID=A0A521CNC0_SACCC|nr:ATP-binding protein [Saccharicrinis carchari]SMO60949.1 Histidine kinase-, DNA gyrase B-, and HSP90-like ATPase [Saccharicrinis carchari]